MTNRTMFDSDNLDDIPATAEIVAFYTDGEPGTPTGQQLQRFAGKTLVAITRKTGVRAKVADIEPGAIWPPDTAREQFANGFSDTAYCDWADHAEVIAALNGVCHNYWIANYDGVAELPVIPGVNVVAKQYANAAMTGGHFDLSVVSDAWPVPVSTPGGNTVTEVNEETEPIEAADGKYTLEAPIVDAVWVAGGCYMVDAKGGVYVRDAGVFHGSIPGIQPPITLHADICTILAADHTGYTLIAEDGGTFRFGNGPDIQAL